MDESRVATDAEPNIVNSKRKGLSEHHNVNVTQNSGEMENFQKPIVTKKQKVAPKKNWGILDVLTECGISSPVTANDDNGKKKGFILEPGVALESLRASIHTLLKEMDESGVDGGNQRVIESMEEFIASGNMTSENNDGNKENEISEESNIPRVNQLHRMLLPIYYDSVSIEGLNAAEENKKNCATNSSLMKILLHIDALQPTLLMSLFQKLPELVSSQDDDEQQSMNASELLDKQTVNEELPRLILSHIRWLDYIVEPSSLANTALECLSVLSTMSCEVASDFAQENNTNRSILLDLISTLPDIVGDQDDSQQIDTILSILHDVRIQDPNLLIPCFEAITSLRFVNEEQLENIIGEALQSIETVQESWLLPALCKFLMQNTPTRNIGMCEQVIETFRRLTLGIAMDGEEDSRKDEDSRGNQNREQQNLSNAEALMLEALSQGMQYRSDLSNTLINVIKCTLPSEHSAADLWLLMCCAHATHNKAKVKSLIKAKAVSGAFTPGLIADSIRGNGIALGHLFQNTILFLADELVRSVENLAQELGESMYKNLYDEFHGRMQRQEIIGQLVIHASSGSSEEIDTAMKIFSSIVTTCNGVTSLRPFLPFLTSLLDNVQRFSPKQLRRLFLLLFRVGVDEEEGDNTMAGASTNIGLGGGSDDVHIIIRKHLSLPQICMKRIGIIGSVCFAASRSLNVSESDAPQKDAIEMLEMAFKYCRPPRSSHEHLGPYFGSNNQGSALSMFLDELCIAVQGSALAREIIGWILYRFSADLENGFIGDFSDASVTKPENGEASEMALICDEEDRTLAMGTSNNPRAPKGEMRFNIDKDESVIYIKFLRLHSSESLYTRELLPQQLCPLLRLLATCHDVRYGGEGLSEIDALLGCALLLPDETSTGIGFADLSPVKKWTVASCTFYAVCWCRELINSFIHAATFPSQAAAKSQSVTQLKDEMRYKVVEKLRCLVCLEEDLRYVASKCWNWTPPGIEPLPIPDEIIYFNEGKRKEDYILSEEADECAALSSSKMTDEEIKAVRDIKKAVAKRASLRMKSKEKKLKQFESDLMTRSMTNLRPLKSNVCLALGFSELRIGNQEGNYGGCQEIMQSLGASELKDLKVGGPIICLLFSELYKGLKMVLLQNKNSTPFFNKGLSSDSQVHTSGMEQDDDNPYTSRCLPSNSIDPTSSLKYPFLDTCISGNVFSAVYEHLATVAAIRGSSSDEPGMNDDDIENCVLLLVRIVFIIFQADDLFTSSTGRIYLETIVKQLTDGKRIDVKVIKANSSNIQTYILNLFDLLEEIVVKGRADNLMLVMEGVDCLNSMVTKINSLDPALQHNEVDKDVRNRKDDTNRLERKVSKLCLRLLGQEWKAGTKFNKSNIGKLVSLYLEHSSESRGITTDTDFDVSQWGRTLALSTVVEEILCKLPDTHQCKGPIESFPTCCSMSFGCYYSAALSMLPRELNSLFDSSVIGSNPCVNAILSVVQNLIFLLKLLFDLTKENPPLAKRSYLLMQSKAGAKFMEKFIQHVVPFLEIHFESHEQSIMGIIELTQKITRQLNAICGHGKREKDKNIAREAPKVRKICETFIHKMKKLLRKNDVLSVFWSGKLKAKNIDGSLVEEEKTNCEDCSSSDEVSSKQVDTSESETESEDE